MKAQRRRRWRPWARRAAGGALVWALAAAPAGCPLDGNAGTQGGGGVRPPGDQGSAPEGTADGTEPGAVSFTRDIQPIFSNNCVGCHSPGGFADLVGIRLKLRPGESWSMLVNQRSVQNASWLLVAPGDPDGSLLFQKLANAAPPVGFRMPLNRPPLADEQLELVRTWIEQGAPNN